MLNVGKGWHGSTTATAGKDVGGDVSAVVTSVTDAQPQLPQPPKAA